MKTKNITFADIDKTAIGGASSITLSLIKCKRAISRVGCFIDILRDEEAFAGDESNIDEFIKVEGTLHEVLNKIIAEQLEQSLYDSDFKEI